MAGILIGIARKILSFVPPRFLIENRALVGFSKGHGAYGGHEGDPTENGCFTEGLHKE